jgi:uncharacterized protein (DUF2147 family)
MKRIIALVTGLIITTAVFAQADPVVGFWLSIDDETNEVTAAWQIYIVNNELRGRIVSTPNDPRGTKVDPRTRESYRGFPLSGNVSQMEVVGPPWIFGLTRRAEGDWRGGNIIDPSDGRMYGCRITFRPAGSRVGRTTFQTDTLEMRGEIGPFGRSQFWTKTDEATANSLWPD